MLGHVDALRVWGSCGCGACPSIVLGDERGEYAEFGPRIVLSGYRGTEGIILFIDGGRPTYLEQYSSTDGRFDEFPHPDEITF